MASLLELIQKKQKEVQARRGREKPEKLPAGNSRWRILPHWSGGEGLPFQDFGQHFVKGFDGEVQAVYICTAKTFGRECAICEVIRQADAMTSDPNAKKLIQEARAPQRYLVNAVKHNGKGYDPEPVLLELPSGVFDQLLTIAGQYLEADGVNIFDLNTGHDIIVARNGTGVNTKYQVMAASKSSPISAEYMKKVRNLADYVAQEYEEGKSKAIAALRNLSGSTTPMLSAPGASTVVLPAETVAPTGTRVIEATSAPAVDDMDALADVDLSELNLEELEDVGT